MGDFSEKITMTSQDEISQLGDALNRMADALKTADDMKNEFISSVSHELRTPLTAIKGWAETINYDTELSPSSARGIKIIMDEAERLKDMVEELLDFSRMQTGHFSLSFSLVDILAELGDAVMMYSQKAKKEGINLVYTEPKDNLPFVNGDKNRIRQVFINILDNAVKYSERGGCVTVEAITRNGRIEVIVNDMGCGVSEENLPKIKTKFFRANLTKRGSGIGLAVANEIVEMHNGTLNITSKEGVGTTVVIAIPYVKE
jgi:signal transduction histidine kinase